MKPKEFQFLPLSLVLLLVVLTPASAAWTTSYDSPEVKIYSLAVYDNKLYAGSYINGKIYVYDGTAWQMGYDSPEAVIRSLAAYNGKLYAGTEDNGIIYVYNGTSWTVSYDTPEQSVSSFGVYNGKLYAGTYPNGRIYVYDGTAWSLSLDTPESAIWSFAVYNNKLYASAQSRGVVYVYDGTSWSESYQSTDPMVMSLAVYNNRLYAGTCSHGYVHVYDGTSWSTTSPGIGTCMVPMSVYNNKLYAYGGGIYAFNGTSWSQVSGGPGGGVLSLSDYNGRLYAGTGDSGVIYAYEEPAQTPTPTQTSTPTPTPTATPNVTQTPTPTPAPISCVDTDGGQNFLVKGACSAPNGNSTDRCFSGQPYQVSDVFCDSYGMCGEIITACPSAQPVCYDGRCVANATPTPTPTPTARDTTPPSVTIISPVNGSVVTTSINVNAHAADDTGLDSIYWSMNNLLFATSYSNGQKNDTLSAGFSSSSGLTGTQYGYYSVMPNGTVSLGPQTNLTIENGKQYFVRVFAKDTSGNIGSSYSVVTVGGQPATNATPAPAPSVTPAPNVTATATPNATATPTPSVTPTTTPNATSTPTQTPTPINPTVTTVTPTGTQCPQVITHAVNPEGKNCRDFNSPCDVPRNWIIVDSCLAANANKTRTVQCDNGCPYGDSCIPFGTRFTANGAAQYCDFAAKSILGQKNDGASCQNSYECTSNYCGNGICSDIQKELQDTRNMLQKIIDFLKEMFGKLFPR